MSMLIFTNFKEVDGKVVLMGQQRGIPNAEWRVVEGLDFTHTSDENKHEFLKYYRRQLEDYVLNGRVGNFSLYANDQHDSRYEQTTREEIEYWAQKGVVMH